MNARPNFTTRVFPAGQIIFREGQESTAAYLIKKGKVKVVRRRGESSIILDIISAPEIFGEMAFIDKAPRSATVEAIEPTELVIITHDQLEQYLAQSPVIVKALVQCLSQRLRATSAFIQHQGSDNNLTSACYCLSLMEASYPSDSVSAKASVTLQREKALRKLARSLQISEASCSEILKRLQDFGMLTCDTDDEGRDIIFIPDVHRLQTEARTLNQEEHSEATETAPGFIDIGELAKLMGTDTSKIKAKLATGEIPDRLIYFHKLELFSWIDELGP